jgi:putative two-component system response regulator
VEVEARIVHAQRDIERAQYETLERLAIAAEARDYDTAEHTYRVGHLAAAIASEMGLSQEMAERIRFAARLHDIGKLGVPDHIMLKPGPLTDAEFEIVKTHTTVGARILADGRSELMRMAEAVAQSHHECWTGGGYPLGISGEQIPLAGRITTVADVFDALTHARPYKTAWPTERAIDEIRFQSGKKFQPEVVSAFLRVVTKQPDFLQNLARLKVA